jgi:rhodanese-related sulfurtransferase
MDVLALILASLALLLAWRALAGARAHSHSLEEAQRDSRRRSQNITQELGDALQVQRKLLARMAAGEQLDPRSILDGQLWTDVDDAQGQLMLRETAGLVVVDVRSPQETRSGILPAARLIPVDQIEERMGELPKGAPILLYCAGGGRSAAACEFLAKEGFDRLHNLTGGFSSWTGPREAPST